MIQIEIHRYVNLRKWRCQRRHIRKGGRCNTTAQVFDFDEENNFCRVKFDEKET